MNNELNFNIQHSVFIIQYSSFDSCPAKYHRPPPGAVYCPEKHYRDMKGISNPESWTKWTQGGR